jgi:hypothetical protein
MKVKVVSNVRFEKLVDTMSYKTQYIQLEWLNDVACEGILIRSKTGKSVSYISAGVAEELIKNMGKKLETIKDIVVNPK